MTISRTASQFSRASVQQEFIVYLKGFFEKENKMKGLSIIKRFLTDERGTETVEWAIIIGLIAVASIAAIVSIGGWVSGKFNSLDTTLAANP